jgi:hypothetical protein
MAAMADAMDMNPRFAGASIHRVVAAFVLVALQATAWSTDNSLLSIYTPDIAAATAKLHARTLAVVDTLPYTKHVSGKDGIDPNTPLPIQYLRYPVPAAPSTIQVPYPDGTTKAMLVATPGTGNAGFLFVDFSGTRRVQFAKLTISPLDGPNHPEWSAQTWYRVSSDGGNTFSNFKQVIASGGGFNSFHPIPGVNIGTNGYMFPGDSLIVAGNQGQDILLPLEVSPLNAEGVIDQTPFNPPYNSTSFQEVRILRGHWRSDGSDLDWEVGGPANVPISQSTNGVDETAVAELIPNGHCLIVSRGSNEHAPNPVPVGHYWIFDSQDGCRSWTGPGRPLGWDDGSIYYAPAAAPLLIQESGRNRIIFMGANSDTNSTGNLPRTRVIAAELDSTHLTLLKHSAVIVDEKDNFDTNSVDLIAANQYYPQSDGRVFYDLVRTDYGYCTGGVCAPANCATALPGCPAFPNNWHILNPTPSAMPQFAISADPSVTNGIKWSAVPTASKLLVYARNPSKQYFWELNGVLSGSATSYVLQGLPANNPLTVNVFAVFSDGRVSSSNQMGMTVH